MYKVQNHMSLKRETGRANSMYPSLLFLFPDYIELVGRGSTVNSQVEGTRYFFYCHVAFPRLLRIALLIHIKTFSEYSLGREIQVHLSGGWLK